MLSIFNRKIKLAELFKNSTDIHNHLLPNIDDGSKSIKESLLLIEKFKELGFSSIVATPHTMSDFYPNTKQTILEALKSVLNEIKNSDVKLKSASEYMLDSKFEFLLENTPEDILTFKDKHVLVEMSFYRPYPRFEQVLYDLQLKGYQPILAHPERYLYYADNIEYFNTLKNKGIKLQLNMLSLTNHYGSKTNQIVKKLLKDNLYDFIGTDAHKIEHLKKIEGIQIAKKIEKPILQLLLNNNTLF